MAIAGGDPTTGVVIITFLGQETGTYDIAEQESTLTWSVAEDELYGAGRGIGSGSVVVTAVGAVGEPVQGTFDVTAHVYDGLAPTADTVSLTGSFSVLREADGMGL